MSYMPGPGAGSCYLQFWQTDTHDAIEEIDALPKRAKAKAVAYLEYVRGLPRTDVRLDRTHQEGLWQKKYRTPEGGLRILFAFGMGGKLWCLGAFVKRSDGEGNKLLRNRYEKLAILASQR